MADKNNLNKTRQALIDSFISCLEEENLPWRKGWRVVSSEGMFNPTSKTVYKGVNALVLMFEAFSKGYNDPRWCTFKQAQEKHWKIKKGAKGAPVEYWGIYDKKSKKTVGFSERDKLLAKGEREESDFKLVAKTFIVFNGDCIEGIPELVKDGPEVLSDISMNLFVSNIKDNMGVGYKELGNSAFYHPATDTVTMPPHEQFESQYEFDSTLLHELSHATGHETRLNRDLKHSFGTSEYAFEELRAEMSSAFLSQYLDIEMSDEHLKNHKAYIQSWAQNLKDDPNILFRAIKDAEGICDYMIKIGELEKIRGEQGLVKDNLSVDAIIEKAKDIKEKTEKANATHSRCVASAIKNVECRM